MASSELESDPRLPSMNITFIGNGKMGQSLGLGILKANILGNNSSITLANNFDNFSDFETAFNKIDFKNAKISLSTTLNNVKGIENADIVFLCVKPDVMPIILSQLKPHWKGNELIISIAAGVTLNTIESHFPSNNKQRVVRVMPNTPALVSAMAGGICAGANATPKDLDTVQKLLECIGIVKKIANHKEYLMDTITGLSGSGPAYAFMFIEALAEGGVKCGLPRDDAIKLAAQTVLGAAKMVLETGTHPAILKDSVTSPGGTTAAAIKTLEKNGFRYACIDAVEAATQRAAELGRAKKSKI